MQADHDTETLKDEIRQLIEDELGSDVSVALVEDAGRIDVRISDMGLCRELESRYDDLSVMPYGDYRFAVTVD